MVVNKMLKLVSNFTKSNIELDYIISGDGFYSSNLKVYKTNLNIVHILNNKVYFGEGILKETKRELHRLLNNDTFKHIHYSSPPLFCFELDNDEINTFKKLLAYEKKCFGNVKINTNYSEWIKNDIPQQLVSVNEETYHQYELRGVHYHNIKSEKGVVVELWFDNFMDFDVHKHYFIDESFDVVKSDLDGIGNYEGELSSIPRRCVTI